MKNRLLSEFAKLNLNYSCTSGTVSENGCALSDSCKAVSLHSFSLGKGYTTPLGYSFSLNGVFIIRDITCRIACLRTWMTWFLTTAQPFFQSWKPNVIIRRLRCGWIYVQKNVYLTRGKGHSKGACQRGVRFIVHPSVYNWVWEFLNWQSEPHIFFEFSWILTNACGIVVVTKKGGCFNETRIIR